MLGDVEMQQNRKVFVFNRQYDRRTVVVGVSGGDVHFDGIQVDVESVRWLLVGLENELLVVHI